MDRAILKVAEGLAAACLTFAVCCFRAFAQAPVPPQEKKQAEQPKFGWGVENELRSSHVWRGLVISDQPVLQASAWISVSRFTFTAWSNLTLRDATESTRPRVTELTLDYERDWKQLRIEPTLTAYFYRDPLNIESSNSAESTLRVSYPAGPLRVFTAHSFDVLADRGAYFGKAGIDYERRLAKNAELEITFQSGWASASFNEENIGVARAAFNLVGAEGSLTRHLNKNLYLRPQLGFSRIMAAELRSEVVHPTFLTFGLAIGVDF